jgi:hypothetical protein
MSQHQRIFALQVTFALLAFVFSAQLLNVAEQSEVLATASLLHEMNSELIAK